MRHQRRRGKLGRRADHRLAVMRNLSAALILHGEIETTEGKGKEVNRYVQKLVTIARDGPSFNAIRRVKTLLPHREASIKLFELAPAFKDRNGGYTQIFKTGVRRGDAARMVLLRFVVVETPAPEQAETETKSKAKKKAPAARAKGKTTERAATQKAGAGEKAATAAG